MTHIKRHFAPSGVYHILNRGVDKRSLFLHDKDYLRFIHDLYEFNNTAQLTHTAYAFAKIQGKATPIYRPRELKPRTLLVEIFAFCLMPNHYHLLVRPRTDNGVTKFMTRLNMGYAKYFNEKYKRGGALFQGRYKSVPVTTDAHFLHLPYYIHCNPLDIAAPEWRDGTIQNFNRAWNFLQNYRWSSHCDYLGTKNFPSVTQRSFLQEILGEPPKYRKELRKWLKSLSLDSIEEKLLE